MSKSERLYRFSVVDDIALIGRKRTIYNELLILNVSYESYSLITQKKLLNELCIIKALFLGRWSRKY